MWDLFDDEHDGHIQDRDLDPGKAAARMGKVA